jgi:gliding motility-associated-like protein
MRQLKKHFFFLIFLLACSYMAKAQKESAIWYFGQNAGLDFNHQPVKVLTDGQLNTDEGCATISNSNGELLFYSDGSSVWNRQHYVMQNGTGLYGNSSSTQSAVIIPCPENANLYYIFTVNYQGQSMNYSIIDMSRQNGLGEVITKNIELLETSTEKITAVKHANGTDVWVIGHEWHTNRFFTWLVTKDGVSTSPIITPIGTIHTATGTIKPQSTIGYMKASPSGRSLALGTLVDAGPFVEIFKFDDLTGSISAPVKITGFTPMCIPYGIEFSPNEKYLYVDESINFNGRLFQIKIPNTDRDISEVGTSLKLMSFGGALQIAPDGRIYITERGDYLHTIDYPNREGLACQLTSNSVYLDGKMAIYGLPTFNQSSFATAHFLANNTCLTNPTAFTLVATDDGAIESVAWNFDDPGSGAANNSIEQNPIHQFSKAGSFQVSVQVTVDGTTLTYKQTIVIEEPPVVHLPDDITLKFGEQLELDAGNVGANYMWSNGATSQKIIVTVPGTYKVTVTTPSGCSNSDEIIVGYDQEINVSLPAELFICPGENKKLDVEMPGASYSWSDGSTLPYKMVDAPGVYKVTVTNAFHNRTKVFTTEVKYYPFSSPVISTPPILCKPGTIQLSASGAQTGQSYNFYNGNKELLGTGITRDVQVSSPLTSFFISITNGSCEGELMQVDVTMDAPYARILEKNPVVDLGESLQLTAEGGVSYKWYPADFLNSTTGSTVTCTPLKDMTYTLTTTNANGCQATATVLVIVKAELKVPNSFTPNRDGVNDRWVIHHIELTRNTVSVYNRYGTLVFTKRNYDNSWDGTSSGKDLPVGVYYYIITLDERKIQKGYLTILR